MEVDSAPGPRRIWRLEVPYTGLQADPGGAAGEIRPDEPRQCGSFAPTRMYKDGLEPVSSSISSPGDLIYPSHEPSVAPISTVQPEAESPQVGPVNCSRSPCYQPIAASHDQDAYRTVVESSTVQEAG